MDAWDCMRGRFCRLSRPYCLLHESFFANLFRWVSDYIIPFHPLFGLIERQQTYSSSAVRLPAFYKQVHLTSSLSVLNLPALQAVRIWWSNVRVGVPKLGYGLRALVLEPLRSSYVGRSANKQFWCEVKSQGTSWKAPTNDAAVWKPLWNVTSLISLYFWMDLFI